MKGINISEQCHPLVPIFPTDISGGRTGRIFSMENYAHASIIVAIGASSAAFTSITLKECTDNAGTGATARAFTYYKQEGTVSGDVLSTKQSATSSGITPTATDGIFYVIELDASELTDGSNWVQVVLTNGVNSVIASVVVLLSGSRFGGAASPTVLS